MSVDNKKKVNKRGKDKGFGAGVSRRLVLVVAVLVAIAWGGWYVGRMFSPYRGETAAWVRIPRDASPGEARDSICAALGDAFGGKVAALWSGDVAVSHGAYRIEPGERAWSVARKIGQGRQTPVKLTFNNVRTIGDLAERIASRMDFSADDFSAALGEIQKSDSVSARELEAQFLPDTYEMYWSATPDDVIARMRANYRRFWNDERLDKARQLGLTPLEVSVLASIAEAESNRRDERGKIARLYLNRLHRGMLLQADPTVKFATGDFAARRITADMLKVASPYNTYRVKGLPPGIIRFPEARTLDAVLNSTPHNYIYMCARPDGSGYHDFTADYSAHLANARAFRAAAYGRN